MRNCLLLIILLFFIVLNAQEPNALIQSPFLDQQIAFEELENGEFISLEIVMKADTLLEKNENPAYTILKKYSSSGEELASFFFENNDSTKYFGHFLVLLQDGRFLVGGARSHYPATESASFLKIINADLNSEDLNLTNNMPNNYYFLSNSFETENGFACVFNSHDEQNKRIFYYDIQGNLITNKIVYSSFNNNGLLGTCTSFLYDKKIFLSYTHLDNFTAPDTFFMQIVDENYNIRNFPLIDTLQLQNKLLHFDQKGFLNQKNQFFIAARMSNYYSNDSTFFSIVKFEDNKAPSLFFKDSTNLPNRHNRFNNINIASKTENNIYLLAEQAFNTNQILIYNINSIGTLKWQKEILIDSIYFPNRLWNYELSTICATKDGGLVVSFQANDKFDTHGVYYYKVDSNGNAVDLTTGIFSHQPAIELLNFLIYPNPSQNYLNIQTSLKGEYQIELYNLLGKQLKSYSVLQKASIEIENFSPGTYFYIIKDKNNNVMQKASFLKK